MARNYRNRPESNPDNPYLSSRIEWDPGEESLQKVRVYRDDTKSIVSENNSPDIPFRFSVNPYRGCAHACAYCYARPTHEYFGLGAGTDFETRLFAKTNAAKLLAKTLSHDKWTGEHLVFSGVTDCYQPPEARLGIMRECLQVCLDYHNPVSIITKSNLILRDLDLIEQMNHASGVSVAFSIPFADAKTSLAIEPHAPVPAKRFEAMKTLSEKGIRTGLSIGPVIPGLNDAEIPALLEMAKQNGASFAFYILLRLPGNARQYFLQRLEERLPEKSGKVLHHIKETRQGALNQSGFGLRFKGSGEMASMIEQLFALQCRKLRLEWGGEETLRPVNSLITFPKKIKPSHSGKSRPQQTDLFE